VEINVAEKSQLIPVGLAFGVDAPKQYMVEGFADSANPYIPKKIPYNFRKELLVKTLGFLREPDNDGLYVVGHTGTGKSSFIRQVAARLNWPVQEPTITRATEFSDLVGRTGISNGATRFEYGCAAIAVRDGHILLINEADIMNPSELAGFHSILDGSPLVISDNEGEVIRPHPKFRLIVTGNSAGRGDDTGLYQGVQQQNIAFVERYRFIKMEPMSEAEECKLLSDIVPVLPDEYRKRMVKVANEIRRLFIGDDNNPGSVTIPFSTRVVVRWARLTLAYKSAPNALEFTLKQAVLDGAKPEEATAILRIAKDVFGELWEAKGQKVAAGQSSQAPTASVENGNPVAF
jgi:cobaltochelatase CobS